MRPNSSKKDFKFIIFLLVIAASTIMGGCSNSRTNEKNEKKTAAPLPEKTEALKTETQGETKPSSTPVVAKKSGAAETGNGAQTAPAPNANVKAEPPAATEPVRPAEPLVSENKTNSPVLYNIGINLGAYNSQTNTAGDILFTKTIGDHYYNKAFLEFGTTLTGPGGTAVLPHPTYILPLKTKVFSPVRGKIENVRYQSDSNDYEAVIVPDGFSKWRISFDHIINLKVKTGDSIVVGDVIAEVAPSRSAAVPSNFGLVELQIWEEGFWGQVGLSTCPFLLLDDSVKNDVKSKITRLAEDWEKFLGKDVYQQEKWVSPGCLVEKAES